MLTLLSPGSFYRKNDGEIGALDYREKAPLAATRDMYLDKEGNIIKGKSTVGATAVGVPGTVKAGFIVGSLRLFARIQFGTSGIMITYYDTLFIKLLIHFTIIGAHT